MRRLLVLLAFFGLCGAPARACLWDGDTLAQEARAFPDLPSVITGRFPRNPPLYYEMRLRRAAAAVQTDPDNFAAYDDAGVSCDRLRRGDAAIAWMEKKRARLATKDRRDAAVREHWYRYHANVGTFWAHRWLRTGAHRARIGGMKRARTHIAAALAINPNAHFGREKYQLAVMDWIIAGGGPKRQSLAAFLFSPEAGRPRAGSADEMIRGLSGLIVLGDAWESLDMFAALGYALERRGHASLAYLAHLRCRELVAAGRRSLLPGAPSDADALRAALRLDQERPLSLIRDNRAHLDRVFPDLRRVAEDWQARRTAYLLERLRAGRHPDTDAGFWRGWREPAPARLTGSWLWERTAFLRAPGGSQALIAFWVAVPVLGLACLVAVARRLWRAQVQRRRSAGMSRPE